LFDFLNLKDSYLLDAGGKKKIDTIEKIEFANVSFTYPNGKCALKDLSFVVEKGDVLALVGENGSGKTTLVKLMAGLYQPSAGEIIVNGVNLREIDPASYRRQISAVFQDYMEYALSLKENVTLAETSDEEFDAFLERTRQKMDLSFVDKLAGKSDEKLGLEFGGAELSGGQWQRLAILRGLKKDNSLLLVDEPTASIDPKQEAAVFDELAGHFSGITVLVTHRLGSVRLSSKIFVLQDGRIVETGAHDDLLNRGGHYAELYNAQANMYK
ncbi:MAG: ATP-binding cassette domain-containing protein, partial [Spirochaetaceae bacterium]|nr:ATP-binding cassette domain-containing protein [Spirochaetaceae bacterium]